MKIGSGIIEYKAVSRLRNYIKIIGDNFNIFGGTALNKNSKVLDSHIKTKEG